MDPPNYYKKNQKTKVNHSRDMLQKGKKKPIFHTYFAIFPTFVTFQNTQRPIIMQKKLISQFSRIWTHTRMHGRKVVNLQDLNSKGSEVCPNRINKHIFLINISLLDNVVCLNITVNALISAHGRLDFVSALGWALIRNVR